MASAKGRSYVTERWAPRTERPSWTPPIDKELDIVIDDGETCLLCKNPRAPGFKYCATHIKASEAPVKLPSEEDVAAAAKREMAERELCRRRLLPFIVRLRPDYMAGWFHHDLAARLERFVYRVERGESPRMIINVPPRRGKTLQASVALPAWALGRNPTWSFIATTHSDDLANDNSRDVMEFIKDRRYRSVFPDTVLDKDNKGATGWRTEQGGRYKPAGVGKGIAGRGANILLIDDPHRDKDAYSETVRNSIYRWYKSSARTRLMPGGGIILIQTRWVLDDLTGLILAEEGLVEDGGKWERVVYPEEALHDEYRLPCGTVVSQHVDGAKLLRKKGECLHPERYPPESNEEHKRDPITWAALYQQDPTAEGAGTVTDELLDRCACSLDDIPQRLTNYGTWDTAVSQTEGSCNTARVVGGLDHKGDLWLVDVLASRMDSLEIAETIISDHREYHFDAVGIEKTNHSVAVQPFLDKYIEGEQVNDLEIVELLHGNKDKVLRARPMQALMRLGKVHIPTDAPWYEAFRAEMLRFPAKPNDIADAFFYLGQLLDIMNSNDRVAKPKNKTSWRDKVAGLGSNRRWKTG